MIAAPAGVPNGLVDLRRAATREDLGHGLRPLVASSGDLAAMAASHGRDKDQQRLSMLRQIVELEVSRDSIAQQIEPPAARRPRPTQRPRRATR